MGYRLAVYDKPHIWISEKHKFTESNLLYYGTKLYGYVNGDEELPERKLHSFQYLVELGWFNNDEYYFFGGCAEYPCQLSKEQFKKFIDYYIQDLIENKCTYVEEFKEEIKPIVELDGDKFIDWG